MRGDRRLAVPAAAAWLTGGVLIGFPAGAAWCGSMAAVLALVLIAASIRSSHVRARAGMIVFVLGAVAAVSAVVAAETPGRQPQVLTAAAIGHRTLDVGARVESIPRESSAQPAGTERRQTSFRATLVSAATADRSSAEGRVASPAAERIRVRALVFAPTGADARPPEIGELVQLRATVRAAEPGRAPSFLVTSATAPMRTGAAPAWLGWANRVRADFSAASSRLPGEGGRLLPGLAIGDTGGVTTALDSAMKQSSLSHLTAVSGSNCAMVIALVVFGAARLGLGRRGRAGCGLAALAAFVVLVTPDPSVVRAAAMGGIVIVTGLAGRRGRGLPVLAAAVLLLVLHDPWIAREYGFVLSVLATGGLLLLAPVLAGLLQRWMPIPVATVVALPLAAQLACQPVLILLSPVIPGYGVVANLIAAPAAPAATLLGLFACALLPVAPGIGFAFAQAAWVPAAWIAAVARTLAALPGSSIPWVEGWAGLALVLLLEVAVLAALLARGPSRRLLRTMAGVTAASVLLAFAGSVIGRQAFERLGRPGSWIVAACDIGQGDAFVIHSADAYALVDTGPKSAPLTNCLKSLHVERIELLVLTHYDLDHVGGTSAVVGQVATALVGPSEGTADRRLTAQLSEGGATVQQAAQGDSGALGSLRWRVLWPKRDSILMQTGNAGSVTVAFDGDGVNALFLGDLGRDAQDAMMAANDLPEFSIVKIAHHGSADQSETLYRRVRARIGLISVGAGNRYGHPRASILQTLSAVGTAVARTDQQGMILVSVERDHPERLSVWSERARPG